MEKAQKLSVLTGSVCRSHGFRSFAEVCSAGKIADRCASSAARNCHILRLLSRPCLVEKETVSGFECQCNREKKTFHADILQKVGKTCK